MSAFTAWPADLAERYRERGYWQGRTLGSLLRDRASRAPDATALVDAGDAAPAAATSGHASGGTRAGRAVDGRRWTYRELDRDADRVAGALRRRGFASGDRILVHLPNVAEFVLLLFGCLRTGVVPVLALPAHRETELAHLASLSGAAAFVTTTAIRVPGVPVLDVAQLLSAAPDAAPDDVGRDDADPSDVAVLLLSGGTTGLPKLIPRTHDDYAYNLRASAAVAGLDETTVYLAALPAAHNFALACPGVLGTLWAGGTVVLAPSADPETAFPLVARERVTTVALVPPLVLVWLDAAELLAPDLGSLRLVQAGGARLKDEAARRVRPVLGCAVQQVYGMAEGLLNFTRLDDPDELVTGTQGRPLAEDDEILLVGEDGEPVPDGQPGELLVRGPYTLRGYYRADDHNRHAFTADGFYRSGDLVRRLPSGHLVVEGRRKDVVNRGGDKVPVEEVENLLLGHPAVHDVALVGYPDDAMGERSCAFVVARGAPPTRADLVTHLTRLGVAAFKLPDRVRVLDAFPRTVLGKVDKVALAALAAPDGRRDPLARRTSV